MTEFPEFTVAAVQAAPAFFDREVSTAKACRLIGEAAGLGASLAVFGETWLSGYPWWAWGGRESVIARARAEYIENAIAIPGPETAALCDAAHDAGIDVVIGVVEREQATLGSVYCTALTIGREGEIVGRHRKLKPTDAERRVWADGDATGLRVHQRAYGRVSALNCWEHKMVLPGYALMAEGTQVHAALWPGNATSEGQLLLSRAFAYQAGCFVVAAGGMRRPEDIPEHLRALGSEYAIGSDGGTLIINPFGKVIAEAPPGEETIITAAVSLETVHAARASSDNGGHYSRPDLLQLHVNDAAPQRLVRAGAAPPAFAGNGTKATEAPASKSAAPARVEAVP